MKVKTDPKVEVVFREYPDFVRNKMLDLRNLVRNTANEIDSIDVMEESLRWGEPSFITKQGSTLRMDWKEKSPEQYAMYFKCTSRLVETFKTIYGKQFNFEGKRAIVFHMDEEIPRDALKECIKATLTYHKVKKLPTLGI